MVVWESFCVDIVDEPGAVIWVVEIFDGADGGLIAEKASTAATIMKVASNPRRTALRFNYGT